MTALQTLAHAARRIVRNVLPQRRRTQTTRVPVVSVVAAMQRSGIEAFVGRGAWRSIPLRCVEATLAFMIFSIFGTAPAHAQSICSVNSQTFEVTTKIGKFEPDPFDLTPLIQRGR